MKSVVSVVVIFLSFVGIYVLYSSVTTKQKPIALPVHAENKYWLLLYRKSNVEYLYSGLSGNTQQSKLLKTFRVKSGIPGKRPTPLPQLMGQRYWLIIGKYEEKDNPETAPYFLTLNIPVSDGEPYGPEPYPECNGQCNWELPGAFGLHGVNGDLSRLSADNPGSSGCVRHTDEDIAYLYTLLDPKKEGIRYYIVDE